MANRLLKNPKTFTYNTISNDQASAKYDGNDIARNHSMIFTRTEENLFNMKTMGNNPDESIQFNTGFFDDEDGVATTNQSNDDPFEAIAMSTFTQNPFEDILLNETHLSSDATPTISVDATNLSNSNLYGFTNSQAWSVQDKEGGNKDYTNTANSTTDQIASNIGHPIMVHVDATIKSIQRELDQVSQYADFLQGLMSSASKSSNIHVDDCISSCSNGNNVAVTKNVKNYSSFPQDSTHQVIQKLSSIDNKISSNKKLTKKPSPAARVVTDVVESGEDNVRGLPPPPLRALSAYNFFFHDERERLLNEVEEMDLSPAKAEALLLYHWNRDRTQKRIHCKTHGKFPFAELSKMISKRWKELDAIEKEFYEQISAKDWQRYEKEMVERKRIEKVIKKSQRDAIRKLKRQAKASTRKISDTKQKKSLQASCSVVSL